MDLNKILSELRTERDQLTEANRRNRTAGRIFRQTTPGPSARVACGGASGTCKTARASAQESEQRRLSFTDGLKIGSILYVRAMDCQECIRLSNEYAERRAAYSRAVHALNAVVTSAENIERLGVVFQRSHGASIWPSSR